MEKRFKSEEKGHPGRILTLVPFFPLLSLFFPLMYTSARSIGHASLHSLPSNQRRHVHHHSNYTHHQVYNAAELVFG